MEVPLSEKTTPSSEGVAFRGEGEASSELTLLRPVSGVHQCHVNNNYRTVISWYISLSSPHFLEPHIQSPVMGNHHHYS